MSEDDYNAANIPRGENFLHIYARFYPNLTDLVLFYTFCVFYQGLLPSDLHLLCNAISMHYYIDKFSGGRNETAFRHDNQRWSRGHKAQGQGHKKNLRPRPRTGMLEAKAKDKGHKCKCFPKKKGHKNFFRSISKKTV